MDLPLLIRVASRLLHFTFSCQCSPEPTRKGRFSRAQQSTIIAPKKEMGVACAAVLCYLGTFLGDYSVLVELKDEIHHSVSTLRVKISRFTTPH